MTLVGRGEVAGVTGFEGNGEGHAAQEGAGVDPQLVADVDAVFGGVSEPPVTPREVVSLIHSAREEAAKQRRKIEAQERHAHICAELGNLAGGDVMVVDYAVEGYQAPSVYGMKINAHRVHLTVLENGELTSRLLPPASAATQPVDRTVIEHLNKLGAESRNQGGVRLS